ncbi:CfaE/CblD family pilus tip adhesin [Stenotrophomonas lactitubi]|uniref:CfaE/CblD family pilus tip adhesin n=1 Tax=Stenotrophomonas lactitubi TaxID=2045214 RepID=UPI001D2BD9AB|nr:CfaE/CblD family pilus tip adhesin [Stenotrophomonas lactitubi]CAH0217311.1 CFA/I fimbrial subunit E [Stenotrophomonas lactitubi]CAH0271102.1 CFA/I fimbrial subunit E [Stenotrophomonas lactitubi]CAH0274174.1 CFA/I fimbrial subunit E [Stenotrophomonas lactitubi]CAH0279949.1 CFA/I fimbrial subunit E [Stenotrophomonas lactitubi]
MNRRGVWAVMLLMTLLVVMPKAWGQRPPETHPVSATQSIVMSWDRSAMPGDIELWAPRTVLGYSTDTSSKYGGLHLTCQSSSNSINGRCPEVGTEGEAGAGSVLLTFVEQRSGMRTELRLDGHLNRAMPGRRCSGDSWSSAAIPLWSASIWECASEWPIGTGAQLHLPDNEVQRLVAGKWRASLALDLHDEIGGTPLARYNFEFDLTITDRNAVSIYFPAFHHVTPLVQLNAAYDPVSQNIGGRTALEMCLYDGLGSQAQYLGVTVRDRSGKPPGPSGYSLWHTDGGSDDTRRLDYTVTLDHNGAPVLMPNGVEQQLHGIDTALLRLVLLPGMSQPVFCVPTPITFDIPRVPISTQQAGTYFGELQVELRVPTVTP